MIRKNFTLLGNLVALVALLWAGVVSAQTTTINGSATNTAGNNLIPSSGTGGCTPVTTFNLNATGTNLLLLKAFNLT